MRPEIVHLPGQAGSLELLSRAARDASHAGQRRLALFISTLTYASNGFRQLGSACWRWRPAPSCKRCASRRHSRDRPDPSVRGLGSARLLSLSRPLGPGYRNATGALAGARRPGRLDSRETDSTLGPATPPAVTTALAIGAVGDGVLLWHASSSPAACSGLLTRPG